MFSILKWFLVCEISDGFFSKRKIRKIVPRIFQTENNISKFQNSFKTESCSIRTLLQPQTVPLKHPWRFLRFVNHKNHNQRLKKYSRSQRDNPFHDVKETTLTRGPYQPYQGWFPNGPVLIVQIYRTGPDEKLGDHKLIRKAEMKCLSICLW